MNAIRYALFTRTVTRSLGPTSRIVGALAFPLAIVSSSLNAQTVWYENTVCPTQFAPISGTTFHAGHGWQVVWVTGPGQWASAYYTGRPSPVVSTDNNARWYNPALDARCRIKWVQYQNGSRDAFFNWAIDQYYGSVQSYSSGCERQIVYDPEECEEPPEEGTGGGGGGGNCHNEWIIIEESTDGGRTWRELYSGNATVCT